MDSPLNQTNIFFLSIVFGFALGFIYDLFRIPRIIHKVSNEMIFFQDIAYFFLCGILTFLFILVINCGQLRFFIAAGEIIGWCIYNLTVAHFTATIFMFFSKIIKRCAKVTKNISLKIFSPIINLARLKSSKIKRKNSKKLLKLNTHLVYNKFKLLKFRKKHKVNKLNCSKH